MQKAAIFVFDFDSTLVRLETIEALADLCLAGQPQAEELRAEVGRLTDQAMAGEIGFGDALRRRLALLPITRAHVESLAARIVEEATPSVKRNLHFFRDNPDRIVIVSGGFREIIAPFADWLGVPPEQVLCNDLVYDAQGRVIGVDDANPLSHADGKVAALNTLALPRPVVMIGDGWTDAEVRLGGAADRFYAFTEIARRENVVVEADAEAPTIDDMLHSEGLAGRWSYPRSRIRILLLENIHPAAVERLQAAGYSVETVKGALDEETLIKRIKGVHILGIRSKTQITEKVLDAADRLMAIAAFCIGVNQIDLSAASDRGVAVFNAPYSNTRSVVELAIGAMITLTRDVIDKSNAMHRGEWNKSAAGSRELRGKTLGIVGYGAIGSQLSVLAEAMGMRVLFHDLTERLVLGNARRVLSLDTLLAESDVVTLHVDGRAANANLFGAAQLAKMKPGSILLNLSRGHILDIDALVEASKSGRIAGAAIDVFPHEPATNADPFDSPLRGLKNVILTPHIGGSTEEAQEAIGEFAAERLLSYLNRGDTTFCVNLPNVQLPEVVDGHRILHIHRNQPGVLAALNQALAAAGLNVLAQYLKTDERVGYVIVDVDRDYDPEALGTLRSVAGTLRFRMLH